MLEPIKEQCEILKDYSKGLCIIPGLVFDFDGYRLGYGKGYYDRFLSRFGGDTAGFVTALVFSGSLCMAFMIGEQTCLLPKNT